MQGWHSRLHGNGDVGDPIIKDKTSSTTVKREKQGIGLLKRKKPAFFCQSCSHENVKTTIGQCGCGCWFPGLLTGLRIVLRCMLWFWGFYVKRLKQVLDLRQSQNTTNGLKGTRYATIKSS